MKTKIIYISGSEVFDMADIRAAFDEVRASLGLKDTILFGVPVDSDDALGDVATTPVSRPAQTATDVADGVFTDEAVVASMPSPDVTPMADVAAPDASAPATIITADVTAEPVTEPVVTPMSEPVVTPEPIPAPTQTVKKSRGRPRKAAAPVAEPVVTAAVGTDEPYASVVAEEHKVIPILSVLASKDAAATTRDVHSDDDAIAQNDTQPTDDETPINDVTAPASVDPDEETMDEETIVAAASVMVSASDDTPVMPAESETDDVVLSGTESVSIDEMLDDDTPLAEEEKTLEELLESMAPLREDHSAPISPTPAASIADDDFVGADSVSDTDATLEQLAAEFAEKQDTIVAPAQNETHGKIGKLKNILPFKKAKRDDSGLMGDLFGWAGIAANDEDFSIPGFFTTAAKK